MSWIPKPKRPFTEDQLDRADLETAGDTIRDYQEGGLRGPQGEKAFRLAMETIERIERRCVADEWRRLGRGPTGGYL